MESIINDVFLGFYAGLLLLALFCYFGSLYRTQKHQELEDFKKGHLVYLIEDNMSRWIHSDMDDMQHSLDEFKNKEQEAERKKQEAERKKQEAERLEAERKQRLEAERKKQEIERRQKEQASILKQYWESVKLEFNNFSKSSDDAVKKAAGLKILKMSEEDFSLKYLKQQYTRILSDYVEPLQENEADKAQKEKVLETVYQELYGYAV